MSAEQTLYLDFDDNRLLTELFGEHDQNLTRVEQKLKVSVNTRGNRVGVQGGPEACKKAKVVFLDLYKRLQSGLEVGVGEVDAAIRLAEDDSSSVNVSGAQHQIKTAKRAISPRSKVQATYLSALQQNQLTFGLGPAGTGKTYLAVAVAASMLLSGKVERLILSRPAVEAGEKLGFLPGDMREKIDPYLQPLYDALHDMMPGEQVVRRMESQEIEVAPLAFMRGRTLSNAFVILDEAQNCTTTQMKMFLTRLGENSRMAITGDASQVDLPMGAKSGLKDAVDLLEGIDNIGVIRFGRDDVVRHPLVTQIVDAYDKRDAGLLARKIEREAREQEASRVAE